MLFKHGYMERRKTELIKPALANIQSVSGLNALFYKLGLVPITIFEVKRNQIKNKYSQYRHNKNGNFFENFNQQIHVHGGLGCIIIFLQHTKAPNYCQWDCAAQRLLGIQMEGVGLRFELIELLQGLTRGKVIRIKCFQSLNQRRQSGLGGGLFFIGLSFGYGK